MVYKLLAITRLDRQNDTGSGLDNVSDTCEITNIIKRYSTCSIEHFIGEGDISDILGPVAMTSLTRPDGIQVKEVFEKEGRCYAQGKEQIEIYSTAFNEDCCGH